MLRPGWPLNRSVDSTMTADSEIEALLRRAIEQAAVQVDPVAVPQLCAFAELVEQWGARMNLSGHRTARSIAEALIGDSIGLLAQLELALGSRLAGHVVDLGSGAGFPGIPMAILRPEAKLSLVEVREKRHLFQRAAIRALGLTDVEPVRARIEDVQASPGQVVLGQAVGPIAQVIDWMRPYLAPGGYAAVPGGADLERPASAEDLNPRLIEYRSPLLDQPRRLWLGRLDST